VSRIAADINFNDMMIMGIMMMTTIIMVMPVDEPVQPSAQLSAKFVRL